MHCVTTADLAATLSTHGASFLAGRGQMDSDTILRYWTASRGRHELWHRAMTRYRDARNESDYLALRHWWRQHRVVIEEIYVAELLTRVVAGLAAESARLAEANDCGHRSLAAVAHGVFLSHIEASNRAAEIQLDAAGATTRDSVRLGRLRRGVDRWSDWLIGRLSVAADREFAYCVDSARSRSFYREVREITVDPQLNLSTQLMSAAMHSMLRERTSQKAALPQANRDVASAVMALFRPDLFDDFGFPKSLWLQRLRICEVDWQPYTVQSGDAARV